MWEPLGELIPSSVKKAGIQKSVSDAMVCEEFQSVAKNILGDVAEHCHAVYIKDRVLWVAVLSNSVSNELKIYEQDILKSFEEKFGKERVVGLRFMV
jgi:predicted nucleic acid-binding Zn ribbon protein